MLNQSTNKCSCPALNFLPKVVKLKRAWKAKCRSCVFVSGIRSGGESAVLMGNPQFWSRCEGESAVLVYSPNPSGILKSYIILWDADPQINKLVLLSAKGEVRPAQILRLSPCLFLKVYHLGPPLRYLFFSMALRRRGRNFCCPYA
jgi:hypothetical protein